MNVVLMGLFATYSEVLYFVKCGVKGFILKDATVNDFFTTIRSVANGDNVLPDYFTESLFNQIVEESIINTNGEKKISKLYK